MIIKAVFEPTVSDPYGYVFVTYDIVNNKYYCGNHKAKKFDPTHYGSGVMLENVLRLYHSSNFTCVPIDWAKSQQELCAKYGKWVKHYDAHHDPQWYNKSSSRGCIESAMERRRREYGEGVVLAFLGLCCIPFRSKSALQVLMYMMNNMDDCNYVDFSEQEWADTLEMSPKTLHKAIQELLDADFCRPDNILYGNFCNPKCSGYVVNPLVCYINAAKSYSAYDKADRNYAYIHNHRMMKQICDAERKEYASEMKKQNSVVRTPIKS